MPGSVAHRLRTVVDLCRERWDFLRRDLVQLWGYIKGWPGRIFGIVGVYDLVPSQFLPIQLPKVHELLAGAWVWSMQMAGRAPWWLWAVVAVILLWELSCRWRKWAKVRADRHALLQALAKSAYLEARLRMIISMANVLIKQLEGYRNHFRDNLKSSPVPSRGMNFFDLRRHIDDYMRTDFGADAGFGNWNLPPYSYRRGATVEDMKADSEAALRDAHSRSLDVAYRYQSAIVALDAEIARLATQSGLEWIKALPPRHARSIPLTLPGMIRAPSE